MSDNKAPNGTLTGDQASPSGTFDFSLFGAVVVRPETTAVQVTLTDAERKQFGDAATYFSAHTNRHVLSVDFPTDAAAKDFRSKVSAYADGHKLTAGFPKHTPDRWAITLTASSEEAAKAISADTEFPNIKVRAGKRGDAYVVTLTADTEGRANAIMGAVAKRFGDDQRVTDIGPVTLVPSNNLPTHYNAGNNVTFRYTPTRPAK